MKLVKENGIKKFMEKQTEIFGVCVAGGFCDSIRRPSVGSPPFLKHDKPGESQHPDYHKNINNRVVNQNLFRSSFLDTLLFSQKTLTGRWGGGGRDGVELREKKD